VVLRTGEPADSTLLAAARVARHLGIPLDIVLLDSGAEGRAAAMASMDEAVHVVRQAAPTLEVRVHEALEDVPAWLAGHRVTLLSVLAPASVCDELLDDDTTGELAGVVRAP